MTAKLQPVVIGHEKFLRVRDYLAILCLSKVSRAIQLIPCSIFHVVRFGQQLAVHLNLRIGLDQKLKTLEFCRVSLRFVS